MFPISKYYFLEQIDYIDNDKYVHLNPRPDYFPSCYHIAKGVLYKKVLKLHDNWEDSVKYLNDLNMGYTHSIQSGRLTNKWGSDENYATQCIKEYSDKSVFIFIKRKHLRIDRSNWLWNSIDISKDLYADSHSIRPYNDINNKEKIDLLVEAILNNTDKKIPPKKSNFISNFLNIKK